MTTKREITSGAWHLRLLLLFYVAIRWRSLAHLDSSVFGWRPTDMAAVALDYHRNGFHLLFRRVFWSAGAPGYVQLECPLVPFITALLFKVLGVHEWVTAICPLVAGFGLVWVTYLLGRSLRSGIVGFTAGLVVALAPSLVPLKNSGIYADLPMVFFGTLGLYWLVRWSDGGRQSWLYAAAAAVAVALAILLKLPALYLGIPVAFIFYDKFGVSVWRRPVFWGTAVAMLLVPAWWYWHSNRLYVQHHDPFGVLTGGALKFAYSDLLVDSAFYPYTARQLVLYHLTPLGTIGLFYGLYFVWQRRLVLFLSWLGAVVLFALVAAGGVWCGHYHCLLPVLPVCALIVGIGADAFIGKLPEYIRSKRALRAMSGLLFVAFAANAAAASEHFERRERERERAVDRSVWQKEKHSEASSVKKVFPLALSANSRYLRTADGAPFLINSSSAWGLIAGLSLADAEDYIDKRAAQGFNVLIACLVVANNTIPPKSETWQNTMNAFTTPGNFSTANPAYFSHADDVLDYAESRGVFLLLVPVYLGWYGDQSSGSWDTVGADTTAHLAAYGRYLAGRYGSRQGIGWVLGGDQYPEKYHATAAAGEHAMADALKAGAPKQFFTGHFGTDVDQLSWYGMHSYDAVEYRSYFAPPWGLNLHYAFAEPGTAQNPLVYTRDREANSNLDLYGATMPTMPHFHGDESYEGEPNGTTVELRRRQHRGMCEGSCGGAYNRGAAWYGLTDWTSGSVGQTENVYWWQFWSSIAWSTLTPDVNNTFVTAGRGTYGTHNYVNATANSTLLVAYFPDGAAATITVAMSKFSKSMRARWWDPTAGTFTPIGSSLVNRSTRDFIQPGNNKSGTTSDWLLILD